MLYAWRVNVLRNWRWVFNKEYVYYYCSLRCFLTNQRFCKGK